MKPVKIAFLDIETSGDNQRNPLTCGIAYIGILDNQTNEIFLYDRDNLIFARNKIKEYDIIVTYNGTYFDIPVLKRHGIVSQDFDLRIKGRHKDLMTNIKGKLKPLGYKLESAALKYVATTLNLDFIKSEIDYSIFNKKEWTDEDRKIIDIYLTDDLKTTKALFDYLDNRYSEMKRFLKPRSISRFAHVTQSTGYLGFNALMYLTNEKPEYSGDKENVSIEGGHRIRRKGKKLFLGKIVSYDFSSAYPHAIIMNNLLSRTGYNSSQNSYFTLIGEYKKDKLGKRESKLKELLDERLKAKEKGDKALSDSIKLIINSMYGNLNHSTYKNTYDPYAASDCTSMLRTWMRKVSSRIQSIGCHVFYGFTDSIYFIQPEYISDDVVKMAIDFEISESLKNVSFPLDSFKLEKENEISLFYIIDNNNYLYIKKDGGAKIVGGFNTLNKIDTPKVSKEVLYDYCIPFIEKNMDVNIPIESIKEQIIQILKKDWKKASFIYSSKEIFNYLDKDGEIKSNNIRVKLTKKYGAGVHNLIAVKKEIGFYMQTNDCYYCTLSDFEENGLKFEDIDIDFLLRNFSKSFTKLKPSQIIKFPKQIGKGEI